MSPGAAPSPGSPPADEDLVRAALAAAAQTDPRDVPVGAIIAVLGRVNGNVAKAADILGVSRPTLYDLMHRFGLK